MRHFDDLFQKKCAAKKARSRQCILTSVTFFFARVDSNRRARAKCGRHSARLALGSRGARARGCGGGRGPVATRAIAVSQVAAMASGGTGGRERKARRRDTPGTGENSAVAPREENVMPAPAAAGACNGAEASRSARVETMFQALLLVTRCENQLFSEVTTHAIKSTSKECVQLIIDGIATRMRNAIAWAATEGSFEVLTTLLEGYDEYIDKARKNNRQNSTLA